MTHFHGYHDNDDSTLMELFKTEVYRFLTRDALRVFNELTTSIVTVIIDRIPVNNF